MKNLTSLICAVILIESLVGCKTAEPQPVNPLPGGVATATPDVSLTVTAPTNTTVPATVEPSATYAPSQTPRPSATAVASLTSPAGVSGPDYFPANINPLTGLAVSDPSTLALPPALISISNFPVTARPQSGLSVTPLVYEVYVGYGMTRFLATVYGEMTATNGKPAVFGPIRSGRLPYEPLRMLLNGFMLIARGDESVLGELKMYSNVWNPASNDVNGVSVDSQIVKNFASQYAQGLGKPALNGLLFDALPPQGGKPGSQLWITYNGANQVIWQYDKPQDGFVRFQDNYDGKTYIQATDAQTSKPLVYENVVVLFAAHHAIKDEKIEIGLNYVSRAPALLFRDGKMYEISWSSQDVEYYQKNGQQRMMRFMDAQGNPMALKPGQTWVEVVSSGSPYFETAASMKYEDLYSKKAPGSGAWGVQFLAPVVGK